MPIGDLSRLSGDEYIAREPARPQDFWLFIHIPKTAGRSLQNQFAGQLTPFYNICIEYDSPIVDYWSALGDAVTRFLQSPERDLYRFASGHINASMAQRIRQAMPSTRLLTFLRHPVARVISDYRYQRSADHPPHAAFKEQFPSIETFVDESRYQNLMFKLLSLPGEDVAAAIERMEREYDFVGTVECYAKCTRMLHGLTGARFDDRIIAPTRDDDNRVELTDALCRRITAANSSDLALWRHFQGLLEGAA